MPVVKLSDQTIEEVNERRLLIKQAAAALEIAYQEMKSGGIATVKGIANATESLSKTKAVVKYSRSLIDALAKTNHRKNNGEPDR